MALSVVYWVYWLGRISLGMGYNYIRLDWQTFECTETLKCDIRKNQVPKINIVSNNEYVKYWYVKYQLPWSLQYKKDRLLDWLTVIRKKINVAHAVVWKSMTTLPPLRWSSLSGQCWSFWTISKSNPSLNPTI